MDSGIGFDVFPGIDDTDLSSVLKCAGPGRGRTPLLNQFFFWAVVAASSGLIARETSRGHATSILVAAVSTVVYVVGLYIPAVLQADGTLTSKLVGQHFASEPTSAEIASLALKWGVELALLVAGERVGWRLAGGWSNDSDDDPRRELRGNDRFIPLCALLLMVGAIATIALPAPALADRADPGQGVATLMRSFLVIGLTVVVYFRSFGRNVFRLAVLVGIALIVLGNVRSPLLLVACGFIAAEIRDGRLQSKRRVLTLGVIVAVAAIVGSVMEALRNNITRDYGFSNSQVIAQTLSNPWTAPFQAGLDTLDGYRFSERVALIEPPRPLDLLNVVLTFIPRAVWPDKPTDLSVILSTKYLGYTSSGQFLSPTGYLHLVTGSWVGACAALFVFALLTAALFRRTIRTYWTAILLCTVVRFMIGGSSFDLFYGLTAAVPIVACSAVLAFLKLPKRPVTGMLNTDAPPLREPIDAPGPVSASTAGARIRAAVAVGKTR